MNQPEKFEDVLQQMPLLSHLVELRKRLIQITILVFTLFLMLLPFANWLYEGLSKPLRAQLPLNTTMIATDVTSTFMAPFELNFFVAVIIAMPFILYQLWGFIAPALYKNEKRIAVPLILSSFILFYIGIAFAYFITLPTILTFFIKTSPMSVLLMTDINSYLDFCLKLFFVFGVTFEIPVATLILILTGLITTQSLSEKRRYIIVGCFAIAMFLTPPDALSMAMLAIPMWLLFELGLYLAKKIEQRSMKKL